ncbi:hypothetical protein FB567DRAFT_155671 [Paraphoma chrysanthemicola]|uniref:Uncharacterized protein n=1 Tax=Paraphoma chrysanthemicola TaxID=798071 RepID=A0A8K0QZC2_9PLEO|nr:hypothetical protein FB567DRAFT_155671 [Paraphoma chrysanthemicola]
MQNAQRLDSLQSRLRADGHAVTLQRIPPWLFIERNGNVLLDLPKLCRADIGYSAVYAFLHHGSLRFSVKTVDGLQKLMATDACLEGAYLVPPFVHVPLELLVQDACKYEVMAMLEYYLLIWAVQSGYPSWVRAPVYEDLEGMFRILNRTHIYADDDMRQDLNEEQNGNYGVAIAANHVRDTVDTISSQESVSEENKEVFSEEARISREYSGTTDDDDASSGGETPRTRLDDNFGETANDLDATLEQGTAFQDTSAEPKSIESIVPNNLQAQETIYHGAKSDGTRENTLTRSTRSETLELFRKEHGPLLDHLPSIDALVWEPNHEDPSYIPLTFCIGKFRARSELKGRTAWAFFQRSSRNSSKSPSMELFTRQHANRAWADYSASRNLRLWFKDLEFGVQYKMCTHPEDVIVLTTYFYLLAQERPEVYGGFAHAFSYTKEFSKLLAALAMKHRVEGGRGNTSISSVRMADDVKSNLNLDQDMTDVNSVESEQDDEIEASLPIRKTQKQYRKRPIVLTSPVREAHEDALHSNADAGVPDYDAAESDRDDETPCPVPARHRQTRIRTRTIVQSSDPASPSAREYDERFPSRERAASSPPESDDGTDTTVQATNLNLVSNNSASPNHGQTRKDIVDEDNHLNSDDDGGTPVLRVTAKTKPHTTEPIFDSVNYKIQYEALAAEATNIDEVWEYQHKVLKKARAHKQETEEEMTGTRYIRSKNGTLQERPATEAGKLRYRNGRLRLIRLDEQIRVAQASVEVFEETRRVNEEKMERLMRDALSEKDA